MRLDPRKGALIVSLPSKEGGFDHWLGSNYGAPLLLTDAPEGNWEAEVRLRLVEFKARSNFHVGLVAARSEKFLLCFGPYSYGFDRPELWLERTGEAGIVKAPVLSTEVELKAVKEGLDIAWLYRFEGGKWRLAGRKGFPFPPRLVGLMFKTWGRQSAPLTVEILRFALKPLPGATPRFFKAKVEVDARKPLGERSPLIFGHFIEHMWNCIYRGGIWAELLVNRKFCGEEGKNKGVAWGWRATGTGRFWLDRRRPFVGHQSQAVEPRGEAGVAQAVVVEEGRAYRGYVVACGSGELNMEVGLREGREVLAKAELGPLKPGWQRFRFVLKPSRSAEGAEFYILVRGRGAARLGCASLMPKDALSGMRRDLIEAIRALRPPVVRWPGGNFSSGYHWLYGIGPRDRRPPVWDRAWGAWEPNDFGTDEFLEFCRLTGAEPYICANAGEGLPEEAAQWVEYCNGDEHTRFGRLRARLGHKRPYHVVLWGIGNEIYGQWQLGHVPATKYALRCVEFARAMRRADPSIKLVAVGVPGRAWGDWNRHVLRIAGEFFDYLSFHHYRGLDTRKDDPDLNYLQAIGGALEIERMVEDTWEVVRKFGPRGRRTLLAVDEWNVWSLDVCLPLRDGLFVARTLHAFVRNFDKVGMANLAQLVNVLGLIRTTATKAVRTAGYWAFWTERNFGGPKVLPVKVEDSPTMSAPCFPKIPTLDVIATVAKDGRTLYVSLLNLHPTLEAKVEVSISGFEPTEARLVRLWAPSHTAANLPGGPEVVRPEERRLSLREALGLTLPPHSLTVLVLKRASRPGLLLPVPSFEGTP